MDNVLILLAVFCIFKTLLMTSLLPGKWYRLAFGGLCAVFVICAHPYAMEQNKLEIEKLMEGQQILMDVSLVVMVDLLLTLAFCWSVLYRLVGHKLNRVNGLLSFIPSMLIFPTLYYIHLNLFFNGAGISFEVLTAILAVAAFLVISGGSLLIRALLPEIDLRLELTVWLGFLLFLLTVCCTIFHPSALVYSHSSPVDWKGLLFTVVVLLCVFVIGYYQNRIIRIFKRKK